jgi:hypothetical protein
MRQMARICAVVLIAVLPACTAQTSTRRSRSEPKPTATAPELFEYVRSALLLLSPDDGINDNREVTMDWTTHVMTITQPGGRCDIFMSALNSNEVSWDIFDPSDANQTRGDLVRLTMISISGTRARTCYDKTGLEDTSVPTNRVRFLFSYSKANQWTGFQAKFSKAMKKLVVLCGGMPEVQLF